MKILTETRICVTHLQMSENNTANGLLFHATTCGLMLIHLSNQVNVNIDTDSTEYSLHKIQHHFNFICDENHHTGQSGLN